MERKPNAQYVGQLLYRDTVGWVDLAPAATFADAARAAAAVYADHRDGRRPIGVRVLRPAVSAVPPAA
jgi:hypothetical protein